MHGVSAAFVKTKISAKMERHAGFEPVLSAWKADVLAIEHQCRKRAFPTYIITPSTSHLLGGLRAAVYTQQCRQFSAGVFVLCVAMPTHTHQPGATRQLGKIARLELAAC